MKKIEYQAPELEIVKIEGPVCLVSASDGTEQKSGFDEEYTGGDA